MCKTLALVITSIVVERISCHFWTNCALFNKSTKIGTEIVWYVTSKIRDGAIGQRLHGHRGGHAHAQMWSKAKIFQKGRKDFIFEPKWPLLNSKQLWFLKVFRKMLPILVNWQLVLISRKINFVYERPRNFEFSLKLLLDFS